MSLKHSRAVWTDFKHGGNLKLAALCLADHADEQHGICWPSMRTIADAIGCSESQARRAVHRVIQLGVVDVVANAAGGAPGTSRRYQINLERLRAGADATPTTCAGDTRTPSTDATPSADATPRTSARDGCHPCAPTPSAGDTRTTSEPSRTKEQVRSRGSRLPPAWQPDLELKAWAARERPDLDVDRVLDRFRDFWIAKPGQSGVKLDWSATFRNWVRGERAQATVAPPKRNGEQHPTTATVLFEYEGGRLRQMADDYELAEPLQVARQAARDYAGKLAQGSVQAIAVRIGTEQRRYALDELTSGGG